MNRRNLLFFSLLLPFLLFVGMPAKSQLLSESFDAVAFPPTNWVTFQTGGGIDVWIQAASTLETVPDNVTPHSGSGMALYDAYNYAEGESAELVTPALDFSTGTYRLKFWMYRDSRYSTLNDSIEVFVNGSSQTSVGGTKLGAIYRHYLDAPVQAATGWYQYTFNIPASFNGATNYISFLAHSAYGTEMVIDDVLVEAQPTGCSGTPVAGVISGPADVCSGVSFGLTSSGVVEATGITYQWQSAPSASGPWSAIAGQTSFASASASQTATTFYRLQATCSNSGLSAVSNVVSITLKPFSQCYCAPPAVTLHSFINDYITNVEISGTTMNCSYTTDPITGYLQIAPSPDTNTADITKLVNYTLTATTNITDVGYQVAAWIDLDHNGSFDAAEYIPLTLDLTSGLATATFAIPTTATEGPTGMRIRARAATFTSASACSTFGSGETEDYTITISPSGAVINGSIVDVITPEGCDAGNNILVKLKNAGTLPISAGAATVALYVTEGNVQGPLFQQNANAIAPGDTATLTFVCSFPLPATNVDSIFISSLAGDVFSGDDSAWTYHITLPPATSAPTSEDFEAGVDGWTVQQLAGSGTWSLASGVSYPDYDPPYTLAPKSGTTVALFDSYNFASGTTSRLNSGCITIPANANADCGYVAGFYFAQDAQYNNLDSVSVKVTTDGGTTYRRLGVVRRQDSTLTPTLAQQAYSIPEWKLFTFDISQFAGQTVQFAFEAYGLYGNQMAMDSFFVGPKSVAGNVALAGGTENGSTLSPALTSCSDANGWTYYTDGNSSRYLFGVQWDPSNTGANAAAKTQARARITTDRKWFIAEDIPALKATYTMQRYWDVNLNGASLTGPVNVRFFYSQRELDSIVEAKNNFIAANPGATDEGLVWFKTISGAFTPSTSSVTPDGVVSAMPLTNVNNTGATINGVLYAQFNGLTSFSGGTAATGVGLGTPLPVTLLSFNANRMGRVNKVSWTTSFESNTSNFVVERSADGVRFVTIGQVTASGNSNVNHDYSFMDMAPAKGINYYRLRIVDRDNSSKLSAVRNVRNEGSADVAVYPNPVKNNLQVSISADKADRATIQVVDLNGKLVYSQAVHVNEGSNTLSIQTGTFTSGAYVIKVQLSDDVVVKKFNKL